MVDSSAFQVWKDEAFELWTSVWGSIYPSSSASRKVIAGIAATYYHVYMVDNNFVDGDIFAAFKHLLNADPYAGSPVHCLCIAFALPLHCLCNAFATRVPRTAAVGCLCANVLHTLCTSVPHARTHNAQDTSVTDESRTPHTGHPSSTFARSLTHDARKRAPVLFPLADAPGFPLFTGYRASFGRCG